VPNNSVQVTEFCLRDDVKVTIGRTCSWNEKSKSGYKSLIAVFLRRTCNRMKLE